MTETNNEMWQSRPVVQDAQLDDHVEVCLPASKESIIVGDELARQLAEDIFRVVHGHERSNNSSTEHSDSHE